MHTVFKYELPVDDISIVNLPIGAEVLHVSVQNGRPHVWARVDPTQPKHPRRFRFAGTGHPLDAQVGRHLGSFFIDEGALVFHVFEYADQEIGVGAVDSTSPEAEVS